MKAGRIVAVLSVLLSWCGARADIDGVQPAALDQPRISMQLRRSSNGPVLNTKVDGEQTADIEAFVDTGASGVLLSGHTAAALGVKPAPNVVYEDVGISGSDRFEVSEPLFASMNSDPRRGKPLALRTQISQAGNALEALAGDIDIAGMPLIAGHVIAIDPKPVEKIEDKLRVTFLDPATAPKKLKLTWHIHLTPVSFRRFTRLTPANAEGPTLADNPMIGPNPFIADRSPTVAIGYAGRKSAGTFLLDTGSACSVISTRQAALLGVHYSPGSIDHLAEIPDDKQFTLTVGGIGGSHPAAGFFLDTLMLPTLDKHALVYRHAPVLVSDITVVDPATKKSFTLDGVFGMNFLVPSANVNGGVIAQITSAPFSLIVLDLNQYILAMR
jgi:hypothetical protein